MKVTDIKQQVKRQERYSIFVDEKYAFSLSEAELMKSGIRVGRDYSAEELEGLQQTAVMDKAYMRSLDLLSRRARSEWELREYLKRKDYDQQIIESVLTKLAGAGYIDDYKFAQSWVASRHLLKNISQRKLWQELKQKRVPEDVIQQVLAGDETDEQDTLRNLIEKKRSTARYQDEQKLIAFLLRQGYRYSDVRSVLGSMSEQDS